MMAKDKGKRDRETDDRLFARKSGHLRVKDVEKLNKIEEGQL